MSRQKSELMVRIHKAEGKIILAICDKELIGKAFEEGKLQLIISPEFYGGEIMEIPRIIEIANSANIINITGPCSVEFALSQNLILNKNIIYVAGIPHAEVIIGY